MSARYFRLKCLTYDTSGDTSLRLMRGTLVRLVDMESSELAIVETLDRGVSFPILLEDLEEENVIEVDPWHPGQHVTVKINYGDDARAGIRCPACDDVFVVELAVKRGELYTPGRIFGCNNPECCAMWVTGGNGSLPIILGIMAVIRE